MRAVNQKNESLQEERKTRRQEGDGHLKQYSQDELQ